MKNTKKVLSVALAGALAFGSMGSAFAADAKLTEGIDNQDVVKAIEKLNAFDIVNGMDDGKYHAEGELTRAQFSKMLVEALGLGSAAQTSVNKPAFNDVDASCQWAWGYINVAQGQGLLSGYPDGTFKPSAKVSYAEALTMLVRALGYKDEFLAGSWPGNYMAKAADVDITDGVKVEGSVNRGAAALLLSNTLDANIIKQQSYGDNDDWVIDETKTLIEDKLDVEKFEDAQVTVIPRVDGSIDKDQITFHYDDGSKDGDDLTYDVDLDKINIDNLLGEGLNVYYDTNEKEIVYVEKSDKEFKTYYDVIDKDTFKDDEFDIIVADKTLDVDEDTVYYIDNEDVKESEFKEEANKGDLFIKAVANEKGNIMVIDAQRFNQDKGVIAVEADAEKLTYFDQSESNKDIKVKDYDKVVVMDNAGKMMKLEDIKANDVVYINDKDLDGNDLELAADKDEVLQLVVVRNAVEGAGESWATGEFEIDNKDYDVSDKATVSVDENDDVVTYKSTSGHSKLDDITAEDAKVKALFDLAGDIRHISTDVKSSSSDLYGVITGVDERYNDVSVKIVNPEGKEVEYELDIDELYGFTAESDLLKDDTDKNKDGLYDFVKYTVNKDGKIDTLVRLANIEKDLDIQAITEPKDKDDKKSEIKADKGTGEGDIGKSSIRFEGKGSYAVSDEVVVFDYTEAYAADGNTISDASDAEIVKWADLDDKTATGAEAVYAVDEKGIIQAILFTKNFDAIEDDVLAGYVVDVKTIDGDKFVDVVLEGSDKEERFEVEGTTPDAETAQMFKKTSSGKLKKVTSDDEYASITAKVVDVDGDDVTVKFLNGKSKTVVLDDAIFYEKDDVKSYSDLDENDYVTLIVKNSEVKAVKLYDLDEKNAKDSETEKFTKLAGGSISDWAKVNEDSNEVTPEPTEEGKAGYINSTGTRMMIGDNQVEITNDTIVYDADKKVLAMGSTDIAANKKSIVDKNVIEVKIVDGKLTSLRIKADFSTLNATIKTVEALNESDYVAEGWTAVQEKLSVAKIVAGKEGSTQAEVNKANSDLDTAKTNLVIKDSNTKLSGITVSAGTLKPVFSEDKKEYTVTLPYGTEDIPTVAGTAKESTSTVEVIQVKNLDGTVFDRTATVTVTAQDGTKDSYTVTFSVATVSSISVSAQPTKVIYNVGDTLDLSGLEVTINYSDSTNENVVLADLASKGLSTSIANGTALKAGDTTLTITHKDGQTDTVTLTIN
jgi:hypothetical protein